jgi:hypothetical protein
MVGKKLELEPPKPFIDVLINGRQTNARVIYDIAGVAIEAQTSCPDCGHLVSITQPDLADGVETPASCLSCNPPVRLNVFKSFHIQPKVRPSTFERDIEAAEAAPITTSPAPEVIEPPDVTTTKPPKTAITTSPAPEVIEPPDVTTTKPPKTTTTTTAPVTSTTTKPPKVVVEAPKPQAASKSKDLSDDELISLLRELDTSDL